MSTEINYLLSAVALYLAMIVFQAVAATFSGKVTLGDLLGPRDKMPANGVSPLHARARRAQANFTEGMIMFIPLVMITVYSSQTTSMTALGAALFFYGRLAFAPLYWFGIPVLRTVAWAVSIVGILILLVELVT